MKTKNNTLQLKQKGYIGLQLAQNQIYKVLKSMMRGVPMQYQFHAGEHESVMVFMGNGLCATLHVQEINPILEQEGGEA